MVSNIQDVISRLDGVGELQVFGTQNAMRVWLDPGKLYDYRLTASDVVAALRAQNAQVSAGQLGGLPSEKGQQLNATITARTLLQTPEQFDAIILRTNPDGSTVLLKDVAKDPDWYRPTAGPASGRYPGRISWRAGARRRGWSREGRRT